MSFQFNYVFYYYYNIICSLLKMHFMKQYTNNAYVIDECAPSPCMNDAVCINGDNNFTCDCPFGYTGTYCHLRDESDTCSEGACSTGVGCVDNYIPNTKYCLCADGWYYGRYTNTIFQLCVFIQIYMMLFSFLYLITFFLCGSVYYTRNMRYNGSVSIPNHHL